MSTIKSDTLQPTLSGNNLIFKTGSGDVERLRITPTGAMSISSGVSTVFAGGVSFSSTMNVNGKIGIGSAYGGTPVVDLDVVSGANASLLDPQLNTYTTTQGRAVAAFRTSATNTTLFFGNSGVSAAWLQVQNSDNTQRSLALNPVGGNVGIGTTGPVVALDIVGQARCSSGTTASDSSSTLTTKSYVDTLTPRVILGMTAAGASTPTIRKIMYTGFTGAAPTVSRSTTGTYVITFPSGVFSNTDYFPVLSADDSGGFDTYYQVTVNSSTQITVRTGFVGGTSQGLKDITGQIRLVVYN